MLTNKETTEHAITPDRARKHLAVVQSLLEVRGELITDEARQGAVELLEEAKTALASLNQS